MPESKPPGISQFKNAYIKKKAIKAIIVSCILFFAALTVFALFPATAYWIPPMIIEPTTTMPTPALKKLTTVLTSFIIGFWSKHCSRLEEVGFFLSHGPAANAGAAKVKLNSTNNAAKPRAFLRDKMANLDFSVCISGFS
jgi:hypothetical protein